MDITKQLITRSTSVLVLLFSFYLITVLSNNIAEKLYLNIVIIILFFGVIPSSFCYLHQCNT